MDFTIAAIKISVLIMAVVGVISVVKKIYDFYRVVNKDYVDTLKEHLEHKSKVISDITDQKKDLEAQLDIQRSRAEVSLKLADIYSTDVENLNEKIKDQETKIRELSNAILFLGWIVHRERFIRGSLWEILLRSKPADERGVVGEFFMRNIDAILEIQSRSMQATDLPWKEEDLITQRSIKYMSAEFIKMPIYGEIELFREIEHKIESLPKISDSKSSNTKEESEDKPEISTENIKDSSNA